MSIKKYNTYCLKGNKREEHQIKNKKEFKINKISDKNDFLKKKTYVIIGILSLVVVLAAFFGIRNFFLKPFPDKENSTEESVDSFLEYSDFDEQFALKEQERAMLAKQLEEGNGNLCDDSDPAGQDKLDLERLNLRYQKAEDGVDIKIVSGILNSGETLYEYLVKEGITPAEILQLGDKVQSVVDISRLNIGTRFSVHYDLNGKIVQFDYKPNQLDAYYIKIPDNEFGNIQVTKDEIFREVICIEGNIKSSLFQAMMDHCNSGQLAVQLAEIFAWDIDFLTECQPGDTFKLLVERQYRGDFYRWGDILAAVYEGEMLSTHTAVLFQDHNGHNDYYDKDGRALRKAFLKAPLNYKYISSYFTENRYHPILRINRPHLAIDYAAPTGTPVVAIGAGSVINRYYDKGGYGNYIEIKHPNGYVTGYGHLSKFADGLKVGKRVEQGEVIGYVGATGLATGPHLDFSISINGKKVNFLDIDLPSAGSVSKENWEDFELVKKNYLSLLKEEL